VQLLVLFNKILVLVGDTERNVHDCLFLFPQVQLQILNMVNCFLATESYIQGNFLDWTLS